MSRNPGAFATVDRGTATAAATVVGRVDGRWRLLGATAAPAAVDDVSLLERLRRRLAAAEPGLARDLRLDADGSMGDAPRLECRTEAPPVLAVVAATERVLRPLAAVAATAGWDVRPVAVEGAGILAVAALLADPAVGAVLAGATDPPGADERSLVGEIAGLIAAATQRRPDLTVILAAGLAAPGGRAEALMTSDRPGATLFGPSPDAGDPPGEPLRSLLAGVHAAADDGRRAMARATATLAIVLERRIELVEIGQSAGLRVAAEASPSDERPVVRAASVAAAALVPAGLDDAAVDAVAGWLTIGLDRLRVRDRLRELAIAPWADAAGGGALLRLAAARAALERLVAATPGFAALPPPDLVVAAGGAWAVAPGPAVALALADVLRRPGASALGLDHARLLGPLGTIEDDEERRGVVADLADDLVVPLGSVVTAAGLRADRSPGQLIVHGAGGSIEIDLEAGGLQLVDLPPGGRAIVELRLREAVEMGVRGSHFAVEVSGGLGGLLVDMRDIPLNLPERLERRREILAGWQAPFWPASDA